MVTLMADQYLDSAPKMAPFLISLVGLPGSLELQRSSLAIASVALVLALQTP